VTPQDVKSVAPDILRHRLIVSYEAEAEDLTSDDLGTLGFWILNTLPVVTKLAEAAESPSSEKFGQSSRPPNFESFLPSDSRISETEHSNIPMIPAEVLKKIRQIEIRTSHMVSDRVCRSVPFSVFKGQGMEFEEVREYVPGDDIRTIDWNVTARMGHPFIKKYVEERELTVMLLVDISGSQHFGSVSPDQEATWPPKSPRCWPSPPSKTTTGSG
jgi:hypothetical protein